LSAGINGLAPCEVAAGMDPVPLRRSFRREVRMMGGFDKRIVAAGKAAIQAEFERLRPVIEGGGFIPAIDHSVSADISFDDYRNYLDTLIASLSAGL
jgi:uroporphyrinogen decarboxylase